MADASAPSTPAAAPSEAPVTAPVTESAPVEATPAVPERDPSLPPRYSELGQRAKADKQAREEQAQRDQDARDAQAYRALVAAGATPRQAAAQVEQPKATKGRRVEIDLDDFGSLRAAIGDDKAFRDYLNGTARHVVSPDVVRIEQQLAKARVPEDYEELRSTVQTIAQERAAEHAARSESAFLSSSEAKGEDGAATFPLLSRLPPAQRLAYARGVISDYQEQGYDPNSLTLDFVAEQTEELLTNFYATLGGPPTPQPATPRPPATAPTSRPQGGSPPRARSQGSRSLTNAMATPSAPPVPLDKMTPQQRSEWALQRHKARKAGSPAG